MTKAGPPENPLGLQDYPLSERRPDLVKGPRNKGLEDISIQSALSGDTAMEDLRITAQALRRQAEIARAAQRSALADNFERAAEMTELSQAEIMDIYEMLRPGRAANRQQLEEKAQWLRDRHGANRLAEQLEEAAEIYERRGLFNTRF